MSKPINLVALCFWIIGIAYILGNIPLDSQLRNVVASQIGSMDPGLSPAQMKIYMMNFFWREMRSAISGGGQLIGLGVVINMLDHIRWNGLSPEERRSRLRLREVVGRLKRWGSQEV